MPQYDFRCDSCGQSFSLRYSTYAAYDRAEPRCSACGSQALSRVINRVSIAKGERNYSAMSSNEMLSVLESGNEKQVDAMFRQVGDSAPAAQPTVIPKPADGKSTSSDSA